MTAKQLSNETLLQIYQGSHFSPDIKPYTLANFLRNPEFRGEGTLLITDYDRSYTVLNLIKQGVIFDHIKVDQKTDTPSGALSFNTKGKMVVLSNADINATGLNSYKGLNYPSLSFRCLARFFYDATDAENVETVNEMASRLFHQFEVVDSLPETIRTMSPDELKEANKVYTNAGDPGLSRMQPPYPGFTAIRNGLGVTASEFYWHRPSTVLLKHKKGGWHYLFGQDEGTYFGCQLPEYASPRSVKKAYTDLMPPVARGVAGVLRQGEWFAVPVDEMWQAKDCVLTINGYIRYGSGPEMTLPKETPDSNVHEFSKGELWIGPDNVVYARNFVLLHDEHEAMEPSDTKQWYGFYKNTAVQSFSEEGVD